MNIDKDSSELVNDGGSAPFAVEPSDDGTEAKIRSTVKVKTNECDYLGKHFDYRIF